MVSAYFFFEKQKSTINQLNRAFLNKKKNQHLEGKKIFIEIQLFVDKILCTIASVWKKKKCLINRTKVLKDSIIYFGFFGLEFGAT